MNHSSLHFIRRLALESGRLAGLLAVFGFLCVAGLRMEPVADSAGDVAIVTHAADAGQTSGADDHLAPSHDNIGGWAVRGAEAPVTVTRIQERKVSNSGSGHSTVVVRQAPVSTVRAFRVEVDRDRATHRIFQLHSALLI